jgi:putative DNA primase/helicase
VGGINEPESVLMAPTLPRPEPLLVNLDQIPGALKLLNQWVLWRYDWKEGTKGKPGKWDKPPYQPNSDLASTTAKHTWSSFKKVEAVYKDGLKLPVDDPHHYDGIGFVPHVVGKADLQLVFGDLDKCRNKETGEISSEAMEDLRNINSFCEPSPSGTGLRFVAYGAPPFPPKQNGRKKGHIEFYQGGHYLTITGQRLPDFPATIEKRPEELNAFYEKHFGKPQPRPDKPEEESTRARAQDRPNCPKLTDDQIIALAAQAHNSPKMLELMCGCTDSYPSQSEGDLALCQLFAFYTPDPAQIDRIFRRSKLYREKWERADYREGTIRMAVERTTEHYSGNGPKDFEAATEEQKPNDQDASESDAAADEAEAKAAKEPLKLEDVGHTRFDKDGKPNGISLSPTKAARAVCKKMALAMSEDATEIYRFDGQIYRPDGDRNIDIALCKLVGDSLDIKKLKEILRRVRNELLESPVAFEPDPYLLGVKNGVCDLRTGTFRDYRPEDLLLERLDVIYDPEARCPVFLGFMESITPVIIDRITLIDWFGATAIKEAIAYVLFLLGLGRNGKGIYEKLIKKFFGMASFRDMPLQAIEKSDFAASAFYRKRGWIASETGKKDKKNPGIGTDFMKLVSGNGVIDGDRKNKSRIQFEPYFQTIVDTNTMPKIEDSSIGWQERFVKVNLPYVFVAEPNKEKNPLERQRDPDLFAKLTTPAELSGILNLVLYRAKKIAKTKTITKRPGAEMFAEYADQSSSVAAFLNMFCEFDGALSGLWTPSEPIYEAYKKWCGYKVGEVVDIRYFGKQLTKFCGPSGASKQGKDKDRNNVRLYKGLNFDEGKCKNALEALQKSMSPDVFECTYESLSCLHEEEEEKSQQIPMSSLSLSNQWNVIHHRFGNKRTNPKKHKDNEDNEDIDSKRARRGDESEDITKTPMKTEPSEADQHDAARDEHFKKVAEKPPLVCAKCGVSIVHGQDGFREKTGPNGTSYYCTKNGCAYEAREAKA